MRIPCPDCQAHPGQLHQPGCSLDPCPACGNVFRSCQCLDDGTPRVRWTGYWQGTLECRAFGWYVRPIEGQGDVRCGRDHPDAVEDLNRLARDAIWDPDQLRYERVQ